MSVWLDTKGNTVLSIVICDRCKMKRAYDDCLNDINFPGLRVCKYGCADKKDPYRLPARQPEKIAIRFPRPDADIAVYNNQIITSGNDVYVLAAEQTTQPVNGNQELITKTPQNNV